MTPMSNPHRGCFKHQSIDVSCSSERVVNLHITYTWARSDMYHNRIHMSYMYTLED